jgi:hypothetical protein
VGDVGAGVTPTARHAAASRLLRAHRAIREGNPALAAQLAREALSWLPASAGGMAVEATVLDRVRHYMADGYRWSAEELAMVAVCSVAEARAAMASLRGEAS